MSHRKAVARFGPRSPCAGQLREILREIAHWAVVSSIAVGAGCSATASPDLGQDVPAAAGSSANAGGAGSAGSTSTPTLAAGAGGAVTGVPGGAGSGPPTTTPGDVEPEPGSAGSGAPPTTPDQPTEWTALPCGEGGLLDLTAGLSPEPPADYLGLFVRGGVDASGAPFVDTYSETGTRCSGASAGSDCLATFEDLTLNDPSCDPATSTTLCSTLLMATRGDQVSRAAGRTEIRAALGAIDTATEAGLVVFLNGGPLACDTHLDGPTEVRAEPDGFGVRFDRQQCGVGLFKDVLHVAEDGTITPVSSELIGPSPCMTGRRPEGLRSAATHCIASRLGAYFSDAARLEAASVVAFERLARELERHGAPSELVVDARRSALDEIRHTRSMATLAGRFGGAFVPPSIAPAQARPRFAIALENAVEGCVRETYGALVAHHQALSAHDPQVRAALTVIAEDETRHAELSWRIARWLEPTLSAAEQSALAVARSAALAELVATRDPGLSAHELRAIGVPSAEVALVLLAKLGTALGLS